MKTTLAVMSTLILTLALYFNIGFFISPSSSTEQIELVDHELRQIALSRGLEPVPLSYGESLNLLKVKDRSFLKERVELGKKLFFDPLLSKNRKISCSSCHIIREGGDDNIVVAVGIYGKPNPFGLNSPTVLNSAFAKKFFWDGRADSLEEQAKGPILAPFEMGMSRQEVVDRVRSDATYRDLFKKAFNKEITFENIIKAIAAYERTLLTRGDYDLFLEGDSEAISKRAKRGLYLFMRIGCKGCHSGVALGGQSIQRFPLRRYHSFIFPESKFINDKRYFVGFNWQLPSAREPFPFKDRGGFRGKGGDFLFRVPILRNITLTSPYFHNGEVKELKKAVSIMAKYQLGLTLSDSQIDDIIEFLKTLEGEVVAYRIEL